MNQFLNQVIDQRIERTKKALEKNNMAVYRCKTPEEARAQVKALLTEGCTIGVGGSESLNECDILSLVRSPEYRFIDRYEKGLSREQMRAKHIEALGADVYITGTNAVTENGLLYNVDGNGNRIAAIAFGPASVIVVVGSNKIVPTLDDAVVRVKTTAAPANCKRLSCPSFCEEYGKCASLTSQSTATEIGAGCHTDGRICCDYLISGYQRAKDRIKVIIVDEPIGF